MQVESITRRLTIMLGTLAISVAWLVPNHYPPWNSFYNDCTAAVGLSLLALAMTTMRPAVGAPAAAYVVFVIAVIPLLQSQFGLLAFSGDAWVSSLYIIGLGIAIGTGYAWGVASRGAAAAALSWAALAASLLSFPLAVGQALQTNEFGIWALDPFPGMRPYANLAQPNNLATLMGFGLLGLLLLREDRRVSDSIAAVMLCVLLIGVALTQSRTALLFGPLILVGIGYFSRFGAVPFRTRLTTIVVAVLCHWLLTWILSEVQRAFIESAPESLAERGVVTVRLDVWRLLIDAMWQSPWTGYGWLQVGAAELAVAARHPPVGELWLHAHNLFLDLLLWCGIPLGLVLCGLIVYWAVSRTRRIASKQAAIGFLTFGLLLTHSMLELPYHYAYFLVPAGLWIGFIEFSVGSKPRLSAQLATGLSIGAFALLVAICKDYGVVEEDFRLMRFETSRIGTLRAPQSAPHAPLLSSLTAFLANSRITPVRGMTAAQLDGMAAIVRRYPYEGALFNYALALSLNGRPDEASRILVSIRHIYGIDAYREIRHRLHARVLDGQSDLAVLEKAWPD